MATNIHGQQCGPMSEATIHQKMLSRSQSVKYFPTMREAYAWWTCQFVRELKANNAVLKPFTVLTCLLLMFIWAQVASAATEWEEVKMGWQTSCGIDRGSIEKAGSSYVFRTSKNQCQGGIFKQRAEINTKNIKVTQKITYIFETAVSFKSSSNEPFILFQIHDGRNGCSPPMSLRWKKDNTLAFDSDYTRNQGMAGCVENPSLRNATYTGPILRRDGTPYNLKVLLEFDGKGAFNVNVSIDSTSVLSGRYSPSSDSSFVASRRFYIKHGVYSQNIWTYEMRSKHVRVLRLRQ